MPCGPGKVVHYESTAEEVDTLVSRLRRKMLFGFAEVDFKSPKGAVGKFDSGAHERVFGTNQANRITIL